VAIQRVLTDNAKAYTESVVFTETAAGLGIRLTIFGRRLLDVCVKFHAARGRRARVA
jgi:hypothetical protein